MNFTEIPDVRTYFPSQPENHYICPICKGNDLGSITKREYFAGLAMQGLISNPKRYDYISRLIETNIITQKEASKKNAHKAVKLADALLEELSKPNDCNKRTNFKGKNFKKIEYNDNKK